MRLAFWNIKQNRAAAHLLAANAIPLDLLALAECPDPPLLQSELTAIDPEWRLVPATGDRVAIFYRSGAGGMRLRHTLRRGAIIELYPAPHLPVLLAVVHLESQLRMTPLRLSTRLRALRDALVQVEAHAGHRRTILLGDLNLDPFSHGLNDRELLIGAMDRRQAKRLTRRITTRDAAFYNPMWSRLGDESPGPPGTWHTSSANDAEYFFHTFDQVLVRPELIPSFNNLEVPRKLGDVSLVTGNDIPWPGISDHLPIIFDLY